MSAQTENTRPQSPPPDDRRKEAMNTVIAHGPGGTVFEIPLAEAARFEVTAARAAELQCAATSGHSDEAYEVGGRHMTTSLGPRSYHSNWLYGSYIWWRDLRAYTGWHWHPNRYNPAAYDYDDH